MKRTLLGGLVLALALFVGQAGTSQAAGNNIVYDGFCDGANLTYNIVTGLATGTQTGCAGTVTGPMLGTVVDVFAQGTALTMSYYLTASYAGLVSVIRADHTWTHYQNTGGGLTVFSSGTWSPGIAVRPNGGGDKPSGAARSVGQVGGIPPAANQSIDIVYAGFCDGAHLTYDIFTGLASGVRTGCAGTAFGPMLGTVGRVVSQGTALTMGYDTSGSAGTQGIVTVIRADHTWTHYRNTGGGITIANSGSWAPGFATRPNGGGPSIQ